MASISLDTIANTTTKAIVDASDRYFSLSGGTSNPGEGIWWIRDTPEYWYTTHIALALGKRGCPVRIETGMRDIEDSSCDSVKGRVESAHRIAGRTDVLVMWKSDLTPRGLVEVKRTWSFSKECRKDADRIRAALRRDTQGGGTLQFGIFAVAHDWQDKGGRATTEAETRKRLTEWKDEVQLTVGDEYRVRKFIRRGRFVPGADGGLFFAAAFLITPA